MLNPHDLYTPKEAAEFLKVNVCSIYQSLPGSRAKPKIGRTLPEPVRLGRLIRWTGQQLLQFAAPPLTAASAVTSSRDEQGANPGKKRGRPRKKSILTSAHPDNTKLGAAHVI